MTSMLSKKCIMKLKRELENMKRVDNLIFELQIHNHCLNLSIVYNK